MSGIIERSTSPPGNSAPAPAPAAGRRRIRREPARHRARGPLRNPLHRRRGAAQLAHDRVLAVRRRGSRLRRLGIGCSGICTTAAAHARDLTRGCRLVHGLARCGAAVPAAGFGLTARARGRSLGVRLASARRFCNGLTRHDLEDRLGIDRGLDGRGDRRRIRYLGEVAQQQHADGGDQRGGHKLIEQPRQKPGDKRMIAKTRASPCSSNRPITTKCSGPKRGAMWEICRRASGRSSLGINPDVRPGANYSAGFSEPVRPRVPGQQNLNQPGLTSRHSGVW